MNESLAVIVASTISAVITWVSARRKNSAEAKKSELDNVGDAIRIWRELTEGMEKRFKGEVEELRKENCDLQKKIGEVMKENEQLKNQMISLEKENKKLQDQLKIFNKNNPK